MFSLASSLLLLMVNPVQISLDARAQQPGEVILVTVETEQPSSVTGTAFDKEVEFFQAAGPTVWQALIGLDVGLQPGEYPLDVKAVSYQGVETCRTRMLRIARKAFATRYLTLPKKYVNPPAEVQERIRRESEELRAIFSTSAPERLWDGFFVRPLSGIVISSFGKRSVLNGQPRSIHSGVDLRAGMGTRLKTPAGGRIVLAKELYFSGNSIIVDHGLGLYSFFAHLSAFKVKEGELVERGQIIGLTGRSGRVQGPHLHWSVRLNNSRVDPMALLSVLDRHSKNWQRQPSVLSSKD